MICTIAAIALAAGARPVPRPAMAERIAAEEDVYGIVHWGLNTYTDPTPANLAFINNILPEEPHFSDLASDPCRLEDNWLVPRTCWKIDETIGECVVAPSGDSPRPEFKPVGAERLGVGLVSGEDFPQPSPEYSTPKREMKL